MAVVRPLACVVAAVLATHGVAASGCDEPEEPICSRVAFTSHLRIIVTDFEATYGALDRAELQFCIEDVTCDTISVARFDGGVACRANASLGAADQRCALEQDGELIIDVALLGKPAALAGEHATKLSLSAGGEIRVESEVSLQLLPNYGNGPACGVTHASGLLIVDEDLQTFD